MPVAAQPVRRRPGRALPQPGSEAGTVTAELAVALPAVVLLAVLLALTGQAVIAQVRCTDAARAAARLAARGEATPAVLTEAGRRAPPGSAGRRRHWR